MSPRPTTRPPPPQCAVGHLEREDPHAHRVTGMGALLGVEHGVGDLGRHRLAALLVELALGDGGDEAVARSRGGPPPT